MEKPVFNDTNLKEKRKYLNSFGGHKIEILYGAKDEQGNSVAPGKEEDGHGCWYGIECNGEYTMFFWKHSREEGGQVEYGTPFKDKAFEQLKQDLETKKTLCQEAEVFAREYEGDDGNEKLETLKSDYQAITNWNTPEDKKLNKRFEVAINEYEPRAQQLKTNREAKEAVIAKVDEIKTMTNFKDARTAIQKVREELHDIESAGKENDKKFNKIVRDAERDIEKRKDEYFANVHTLKAQAKEKKTAIIEETRKIIENVTNWKVTSDKMESLFEDWKKAGFSGKESDDALWKEYNELRNQFYGQRKAFIAKRNEEWKAIEEKKTALIEEAKKIVETNDRGKNNTNRMKELDKEWKAAGFCGRDTGEKLWKQFNEIKESFWQEKKAIAVKRFQEDLDAKKAELEKTVGKVKDLEDRLEEETNSNLTEGFERELYVNKGKLETLQQEIQELEEKIKS